MEIGAPRCDLTADEIWMQFYMKVTSAHAHACLFREKLRWREESSQKNGSARLHPGYVTDRRDRCMFVILRLFVSNTVGGTGVNCNWNRSDP